ncbi:MAG: hypothetical protein M1814_006695 [Vezdaea aestivalis]|nr:MAG: hypothetical protein M1814_006695 [Vezdaea aestivalis]
MPKTQKVGRRGIELLEAPLCNWCQDDMKGVSEDERWRKGVEVWREVVSRRTSNFHDGAGSCNEEVEMNQASGATEKLDKEVPIRKQGAIASELPAASLQPNPTNEDRQQLKTAKPDKPVGYVSIYDPLARASFRPVSRAKLTPKWMALLPGNRSKPEPLPFRVRLPSQALKYPAGTPSAPRSSQSSANTTIMPLPIRKVPRAAEYLAAFPPGELKARYNAVSTAAGAENSQLALFPFFQNPRAPIVPSIDSSWGRSSLASVKRSRGQLLEANAATKSDRSEGARQSEEFIERYAATPFKMLEDSPVCVICDSEGLVTEPFLRIDNMAYHHRCLLCKYCNRNPTNSIDAESYVVFRKSIFHKKCVAKKADSILSKMKKRKGPENVNLKAQGTVAMVMAEENSKRNVTNKQLSSLFSKVSRQPIPSGAVQLKASGNCESCRLYIKAIDLENGPRETQWHRGCLACHSYEKALHNPTWYEWNRDGRMKLSCQKCWWAIREGRGMEKESIWAEEESLLGLVSC